MSELECCYSICIKISRRFTLHVGRLGAHTFYPGYYVYTGRDRRGAMYRIRRHRQKKKKCRWHIDYLTTHPDSRIVDEMIYRTPAEAECRLNKAMTGRPGAEIPIPGFGASDCRSGCSSHLVYFTVRPVLNPGKVCE